MKTGCNFKDPLQIYCIGNRFELNKRLTIEDEQIFELVDKPSVVIRTKTINNDWFCYATIEGQDYSYNGINKIEAMKKMLEKLISANQLNNVYWDHLETE